MNNNNTNKYIKFKNIFEKQFPTDFKKTSEITIIGTHPNKFHCDDSTAICLLVLTGKYDPKNTVIIRTRDNNLLKLCDIVVDVGGKYEINPQKNEKGEIISPIILDHHQKEFTEKFSDKFETKLSSCGLIFKHFGKDIILKYAKDNNKEEVLKNDKNLINVLHEKIYKSFIEHIDADDNGIPIADGTLKYQISTSICSRVSYLNPSWNHPQQKDEIGLRFEKAINLCLNEFIDLLDSYFDGWLQARQLTREMVKNRFKDFPEKYSKIFKGRVLKQNKYFPWRSNLQELEQEQEQQEKQEKQEKQNNENDLNKDKVLYICGVDYDNNWRIQCVGVTGKLFVNRLSLPKKWRGLRNEELEKVSNVKGSVFCHSSGFLGINKTFEGALEMIKISLEQLNDKN